MRLVETTGTVCITILLLGFLMGALPETANAADGHWRPTYDLAMRWVNFIILVAVIVKYAREPIKDFLTLQKKDLVSEIDALETEKARILVEIKAVKQKGVENQERLKELKDRMIAQGEIRKKQIVEQARQQSAIMLEGTRRKMAYRILQAKDSLKTELLDMAIDQAMATLPRIITAGDNHRLLDDYMNSLDI